MNDSRTILVTGGAGYIGSHTVLALQDAGWPVVVLDDLSNGDRDLVPGSVPFIEGDVGDHGLVTTALREHGPIAVMHFAGSIVVSESVVEPLKYYRNNTDASRRLIECCVAENVRHFVFSSSAAVYGNPDTIPIDENAPTQPVNPYGTTKLVTEWLLRDVAAAADLRYAILRYFNVAGADAQLRSGECSQPATHLIKVASEAAVGKRPYIKLYGSDYDTPDGTCIRDYVHVTDLASAHVSALEHLIAGKENLTLNCGYGRGFSVREVLSSLDKLVTDPLDIRAAPRRPGDAAQLVAKADRIRETLAWSPEHDDIDEIVASALAWERKLMGER